MGEVVGGGFPCVTHVSAFFMGVGGTKRRKGEVSACQRTC